MTGAGIPITRGGHQIRPKRHRLRRRGDPLLAPDSPRAGVRPGAPVAVDLRVRADGGFAGLHGAIL